MNGSVIPATLPLQPHEVMEEEYQYFDGPLSDTGHNCLFDENQIMNVKQLVSSIPSDYLLNKDNKQVEKLVNSMQFDYLLNTCKDKNLQTAWNEVKHQKELNEKNNLTNSVVDFFNIILQVEPLLNKKLPPFAISPQTIKWAKEATTTEQIAYANRFLLEDAFPGYLKRIADVRLAGLNQKLHQKDDKNARIALCLSGGGIRSATFALGIIQGLAHCGLLKKINYLSTVSGGGYIGSWLSSWASRHPDGLKGVEDELKRRPESPLEPEPESVRYLRKYTNYLSPAMGWLSADTWTLAATYLRNLLLTWLIFIPLLMAVTTLPRLGKALIAYVSLINPSIFWYWFTVSLVLLCSVSALSYLRTATPYIDELCQLGGRRCLRRTRRGFFCMCLLPLLVAAFGFTLLWVWRQPAYSIIQLFPQKWQSLAIIAICIILLVISWAVSGLWILKHSFVRLWQDDLAQNMGNGFVTILAGTLGGLLLWVTFTYILVNPANTDNRMREQVKTYSKQSVSKNVWNYTFTVSRFKVTDCTVATSKNAANVSKTEKNRKIYACFAVPSVLLTFLLIMTLFIPCTFNVKHLQEENLEWLGRFAGIILKTAVLWAGVNALSLFGLLLFDAAAKCIVAAGGIAGIVTLVLGWSAKTPASSKNGKINWRDLAAKAAAPVALIVFYIMLVILTNFILNEYMEYRYMNDYSRVIREVTVTLFAILLLLIISITAGSIVDCNRFSLHGIYRNRLIRAYLGASRQQRTPNWFTGFDDNDNMPLYQLRQGMLKIDDILNPFVLCMSIKNRNHKSDLPADKISHFLCYYLKDKKYDKELLNVIDNMASAQQITPLLQMRLVSALNRIICQVEIKPRDSKQAKHKALSWLHLIKRIFPKILFEKDMSQFDFWPEMNIKNIDEKNDIAIKREFLVKAYPDIIKPLESEHKMLHIVNTALNLAKDDNFAWEERKAASFTFSPLHCGNHRLGYCRAENYRTSNDPRPISLGTALTISGAAVSPNMGYHSSAPVTFILALFNVRLGCWLRNPWIGRQPKSFSFQLMNEAIGNTNDDSSWVYLSDGGHFENLGLYEMVLRRCRFILVSDAGCDPEYKLEDIGNAVRKIRIDLGISIKMHDFKVEQPEKSHCCAVGIIDYKAIDDKAENGYLIYIKAGMCDQESLDVISYKKAHSQFPHDTTADQFFSESQFESYRALGEQIIKEICTHDEGHEMNWSVLRKRIEQHICTVEGMI